jgi:hypothetical protein
MIFLNAYPDEERWAMGGPLDALATGPSVWL